MDWFSLFMDCLSFGGQGSCISYSVIIVREVEHSMLRIAICDDDSAAVQSNRSITEDCLKQCGSAGEIAAYTHSEIGRASCRERVFITV